MYEPITTGALTLSGPITGMLVGLPLALFEVRFLLEFTFHNISRTGTVNLSADHDGDL